MKPSHDSSFKTKRQTNRRPFEGIQKLRIDQSDPSNFAAPSGGASVMVPTLPLAKMLRITVA